MNTPTIAARSAARRAQTPQWGGRLSPGAIAVATAAIMLDCGSSALGQVATALNGPPVQVQPYVAEPGVPLITINPGTPNPFSGAGDAGTGTGGDSGASTGGGNGGGSEALNLLIAAPDGTTIINNAQSIGVNASAVAATCALESGCQNVGGSGAQGMFQMYPAAFQEGLQTALAANPALASQIVPGDAGRMDPVTEAIAASGYLMQGAQALQNAGIQDPTVLQTRSYFNFGPRYASTLAQASDDQNMSSLLPTLSASQLQANGVTSSTTVGQWRASISSKIGTAAGQSVLI